MRVCKHYFMNILLLKQIYSLAENESVLFTVNNVKFQSNLDLSQIAYKDNVTGIDTLSEIGLNGIPILICESTRIESVDPFSKNTKRTADWQMTFLF